MTSDGQMWTKLFNNFRPGSRQTWIKYRTQQYPKVNVLTSIWHKTKSLEMMMMMIESWIILSIIPPDWPESCYLINSNTFPKYILSGNKICFFIRKGFTLWSSQPFWWKFSSSCIKLMNSLTMPSHLIAIVIWHL